MAISYVLFKKSGGLLFATKCDNLDTLPVSKYPHFPPGKADGHTRKAINKKKNTNYYKLL